MIKMILTDLDHTLLRQDGSISDETLSVLAECRAKGILFAIATARYWIGAERYIRQLTPDFEITTDGTLIHTRGTCIYSCAFTEEQTNRIIQRILRLVPEAEITAACGKDVYWNSRHIAESEKLHKAIYCGFASPLTIRANKIAAELPSESIARQIAQETDCLLQCYRGEKWYAFLPKGAGKTAAIHALVKASGILPDDIAAFGDDANDMEMLRMCGRGVAVANAMPEVLRIADDITLSNDQDGVALWLNCHCLYPSLLAGAYNTRDLGGYPAGPGRRTVRNRIWRSGALTKWNASDAKAMKDAGMAVLIDLRTREEAQKSPCAYAGADGFDYHPIPIIPGSAPPDTLAEVPLSYLEIARQPETAEALRTIAGAQGGVLFFCTAGKDRTGVLSALLLLACEVDPPTIVKDYAVSREYNRLRLEQYLAGHPGTDRRVVMAHESSMERFLALFLDQYGNMEHYFERMGLSAAQLARIRRKLLETA